MVDAALRELDEETGVAADDPEIMTTLDAIDRDETGRVRHHYTLIVVLLRWLRGEPMAADDADAAGWFRLSDLDTIAALPTVAPLMLRAAGLRPV